MRRLGHLADLAAPAGEPLRVLHLGGGGLTLARYVAAARPGSSQLAVDAMVPWCTWSAGCCPWTSRAPDRAGPGRLGGQAAERARAGRVRVRVGDARAVLAGGPGRVV